jgi:alkylation response protein AidB-like acyl-CoA dehydrogenase
MNPAAVLTALVEDLERHLGDPFEPTSRITARRILELDEREAYPHELLSALHTWNAHEYAIPARWGGRAVDIENSLHLMRQVARRDATVATALSISSLSYMPIWVAGTEQQRLYYASQISSGAKMSWGLSERDHGSDLLSNELTAQPVEGGYLVSGEKWLIGNATLADFIVLHARTRPAGGPAGFTLLVLDKRSVPAALVETLPGERLHGLRGIDMSGVRLSGCFIPDSARIGREGTGLEIALQASHAVRSMITSIALGCTDTALRLTLDFAVNRQIFGARVSEIPYTRRQLADSYAELLVGEAVAMTSARSLQVCPDQSSVFSAISKYFVPTLLQGSLSRLAVVLGARHYLREHPRFGLFQKALRDAPVADFADGNTVVNLKNIVSQLGSLLSPGATPDPAEVANLFDLSQPLPGYEPWRQSLASRHGRDHASRSLPAHVRVLLARAAVQPEPARAQLLLAAQLAGDWLIELDRIRTELAALKAQYGTGCGQRPELFELARRYCLVHAAACVTGLWAHAGEAVRLPPIEVAVWCLRRLSQQLHPYEAADGSAEHLDRAERVIVAHLLSQHERGEAFSLRTMRLQAAPLRTAPAGADLISHQTPDMLAAGQRATGQAKQGSAA